MKRKHFLAVGVGLIFLVGLGVGATTVAGASEASAVTSTSTSSGTPIGGSAANLPSDEPADPQVVTSTSVIVSTAMTDEAATKAAANVQKRIAGTGVVLTSVEIVNSQMKANISTSGLDKNTPHPEITPRLVRAACAENLEWLDYSYNGRQTAKIRLPELNVRPAAELSVAETQVTSWLTDLASKNKVTVKAHEFENYELYVEVYGDKDSLEQFAQMSMNYGLEPFEKGQLNWLEVTAKTGDGTLCFKGVSDYQTGMHCYYKASGFGSEW
jgi:hypothetical protein